MSILDLDAKALTELILSRKTTSYNIVYEHIKHISKLNRSLNCIAEQRFEKALAEAKIADEQLEAGQPLGRLHGVPISIQESFNVDGMYTTDGIPYQREHRVKSDARIVAQLKREGAIIIAKTNTAALLYYHETTNSLYGKTVNPWDNSLTSGGASGGEGVMVAVGGSALGIASDISGCIRMPAHYNGVIGFKRGKGEISHSEFFPFFQHNLQKRMIGIGAFAKSMNDIRLINEIIAKEEPPEVKINDFSVVIPLDTLNYPVDRKTKAVLRRVIYRLEEELSILDEQPPYYTKSALLWKKIMSINGGKEIAELAFGYRPVRIKREWIKSKFVKDHPVHKYLISALLRAQALKPSDRELKKIEETIKKGDEQVAEYLNNKVLILPVYHTPATKHGKTFTEMFSIKRTFKRYMPFLAYANTWGLPSLTIPIDESREGLPIAVQVISKVGNEEAIFKIATILEDSFRGYKRCRSLNIVGKTQLN